MSEQPGPERFEHGEQEPDAIGGADAGAAKPQAWRPPLRIRLRSLEASVLGSLLYYWERLTGRRRRRFFYLFDRSDGNLIRDFDRKDDALFVVWTQVTGLDRADALREIDRMALIEWRNGEIYASTEGSALLDLAQQHGGRWT